MDTGDGNLAGQGKPTCRGRQELQLWKMRRRRIILLAATTVGASLMLVPFLGDREPSYQGRSLSAWLAEFDRWSGDTNAAVVYAVRAIGTNGIPLLVSESMCRDSKPRQFIEVKLALHPGLVPFHVTSAHERSGRANIALRLLGTQTEGAYAYFASALTNRDPEVRRLAAGSLRQTGLEATAR